MLSASDIIESELLSLGASPDYIGYRYLLHAIELTLDDGDLIYSVTTRLYPVVAEYFGVRPSAVERGIRTLVSNIWREGNQERLVRIMVKRTSTPPGNAKFIGMLSRRLAMRINHAGAQTRKRGDDE